MNSHERKRKHHLLLKYCSGCTVYRDIDSAMIGIANTLDSGWLPVYDRGYSIDCLERVVNKSVSSRPRQGVEPTIAVRRQIAEMLLETDYISSTPGRFAPLFTASQSEQDSLKGTMDVGDICRRTLTGIVLSQHPHRNYLAIDQWMFDLFIGEKRNVDVRDEWSSTYADVAIFVNFQEERAV